jgi:hypothetical protein
LTDDRLALFVRAAMRGFMEAVLAVDEPTSPAPQNARPESVSEPEEIAFPSVTAAEDAFTKEQAWGAVQDGLFGEAMPQGNADLDAVLAARARERAYAEQNLQPQHQGGPGEKDVAEWLRLPQQ